MSFSSKVLYTGDGVQKSFTITFPYMELSHIRVFVNEIFMLQGMDWTFTGGAVLFEEAPGDQSALVDFVDGSTLRANDLDTAYLHNYYLGQEYADSFNEVINEMILKVATGQGIVETDPDEALLALVNEMLSTDAAANLQQRIDDIDANAEAIVTLGESLQVQINTLAQGTAAVVYVQASEPVPGVGGIPDPIPDNARWYDSDDNNHPYIYDQSVPEWVSLDDPRIGVADAAIDVLQVQMENSIAAIVDEQFVRATEMDSFAQQLGMIGAVSGDYSAFIVDLDTVYAGPDETFADRFSSLDAADGTNAANITAEQTARISADGVLASDITALSAQTADDIAAAVLVETNARVTADAVVADELHLLGVQNGAKNAFIMDTSTVKIDSDTGDTWATKISTLEATDGQNTANITTINDITIPGVQSDADAAQADATQAIGDASTAQTGVNTLMAKYGVTLNVNGYITGFAQNNDGTTGTFVILADKFAVVDPSGDPGETQYVPFEISGGKINMRSDVQIDGDLLVSGSINGQTALSTSYPLGTTLIGPNAIYSSQIAAGEVKAVNIEANSINADKIVGDQLDVLAAKTGTLNIDESLTMANAGHIKGGQTAFDTGAGFWLGYDTGSSKYKFSIGDGGSNTLTWDGTTLTVRGELEAGEYVASTTSFILEANTERTTVGSDANPPWVEEKGFSLGKPGQVYVRFEQRRNSYSGSLVESAQARIVKNNITQTTYTASSTTYTQRSYLMSCNGGDTVDIDCKGGTYHDGAEYQAFNHYIKNAKIGATLELTDGGSVDHD
jgi:hypothetical protein